MNKKRIIAFALGVFVFLGTIITVKAADLKYSNSNWLVGSNGGLAQGFYNNYPYVITDFSPRVLTSTSYPHKTRYEAYAVDDSYSLKQNKTYNISTNASGYFSLGYVGVGNVDVYNLAYDNYHSPYVGWLGTQRFLSSN